MYECLACICIWVIHVYLVPVESTIGVRSCGSGVTDSCEQLSRYWESGPGWMEEQPVLLATSHLSSSDIVTFLGGL